MFTPGYYVMIKRLQDVFLNYLSFYDDLVYNKLNYISK